MARKYEYTVKEPEKKQPERIVRKPEYDFNQKSSLNEKLLIRNYYQP